MIRNLKPRKAIFHMNKPLYILTLTNLYKSSTSKLYDINAHSMEGFSVFGELFLDPQFAFNPT